MPGKARLFAKQAMFSASLAQGRQNKGKDNPWLWEMPDFTYLALQKKTLRPITLIEESFTQHFISSDNIWDGKAVFSLSPASDVFQQLFSFFPW